VTGRILAEKPDQVIIDIGYTVLAIPRAEVVEIVSPAAAKAAPKKAATKSAPTAMRKGFYQVATTPPAEQTVRELVTQLGEAVVQVRTPGGLGSGFFINEEGYLRIVAMNKFADLTLLKVEDKDAPKFKWVPIGDVTALSVGEKVFAIGSPLGLERTVTEGIVSTKTRQMQGSLYLQTSTAINPGNSGGPLFNLRGEVVGVTNMKLTFAEGLGFAIPSDQLKYFLDYRDAYAYDTDNPSNPFRYLDPPSRLKVGETEKSEKAAKK
jgi:serine protease Do